MLGFFRNRRRRRILAEQFPDPWLEILSRNVHLYGRLPTPQQAQLRDDLRVFIAERYWDGAGIAVNDEMRVTIAAHACLLTLNLPKDRDWYRPVRTVIVHPESFLSAARNLGAGGVVSEGFANSGEAWHNGPVILSWQDVVRGGRDAMDGRNVALHEFAHVLDMADGLSNGTPPLTGGDDAYKTWHAVMSGAYERLITDAEFGHATLLDTYGATNVAEFFAVATEAFFERGPAMRHLHADVYAVMQRFYRHNPAHWSSSSD